MGLELDQVRAAGTSVLSSTTLVSAVASNGKDLTVGDEPLVIDLIPLGGWPSGYHWIVENISGIFYCAVRAPQNAGTPVCGLFAVPMNAKPETTQDASGNPGFSIEARGLILPLDQPGVPAIVVGPGPNYAVGLVLRTGFKTTIPYGHKIRAILNCAPGAPAPGPGAGSYGKVVATVKLEKDTCECP